MRASYAVGLDVGGTRIAAGLGERKGRIVKEVRCSTPTGGPCGVVDGILEASGPVLGAGPPAGTPASTRCKPSCRGVTAGDERYRGQSRRERPAAQ